jgi:hypothetical protein
VIFKVLTAAIIALMMKAAASTSETSAKLHQTSRRNNPEDSHLHRKSFRQITPPYSKSLPTQHS